MLRVLTVPVIMSCALVGTVGMLKAIKKISPEQFNKHENAEKRDDKTE